MYNNMIKHTSKTFRWPPKAARYNGVLWKWPMELMCAPLSNRNETVSRSPPAADSDSALKIHLMLIYRRYLLAYLKSCFFISINHKNLSYKSWEAVNSKMKFLDTSNFYW